MEEEEEEKKPFDGCQQNKRHHRHREVWASLRRVARLRPVGESGRRGVEPWTQGQAR